ncbi:MAG: AAA-like domain-containing protein [Pseudomonadota bacterium]
MTEPTNIASGGTATHRFEVGRHFVVGGVVPVDRSLYLERAADDELYRLAMSGEYAHVFAARQAGKSSLTARVAERLREQDRQVAVIDLEQIGSRDDRNDLGRWFYSFAFRLLRQLRIKVDLQDWWQDKSNLTNRQRLTELFWDLILSNTDSPVTVFIDSPQSFDSLPFAAELLGSIDALHAARAAEPTLARLNFVLLAVADPEGLRQREDLAFFGASTRVELRAFTRAEIDPLVDWLPMPPEDAGAVLDRIHYWTSGQPFLTMKLARRIARQAASGKDDAINVDESVKQLFGNATVLDTEPHIGVIQRALLSEMPDREQALNLYGRIRKGNRVSFDVDSSLHRRLLDEAVLKVDESGHLMVANRIYAYTLTTRWANEQLAVRLRTTLAMAVGILVALVVPLWYVEILPRHWVRTIQNPPLLEDATEAHERMRAWPGHRKQANDLLADYLARRSLAAFTFADAAEFDRLMRELPGTVERADGLLASFWDRDAARHEQAAARDKALLSRLRSLDVATVERRRAVQSLIDEDYARLVAAVGQAPPIDDAALSTDASSLTTVAGATVRQFLLGDDTSVPDDVWQAAALDVFPVISRLPTEGRGNAGPFDLTVRVTHDRVTDLSLRLTSPSGQSALISGVEAEVLPGGGIRFSSQQIDALAPLEREAVTGGWTLSVVDRMPAIAGELDGWQLEFSRHGSVETPSQPTVLREPVVAPVSRAVLSPRARYVVAMPETGSGIAQVWETATRQAVSSLPIDPTDRILGFVLDERVLLVARPQGLAAWALATGEASWAPPIETSLLRSALSLNRQFLATVGAGADAELVVFDLIEERETARLPAAAELSALAVANDGELVAMAYADQTVRLWQSGSKAPVAEVAMAGQVTALDFSADDERLFVRAAGGTISIWDFSAADAALEHRAAERGWELDVDSGGRGVVLGSASNGFQVVDAESLTALSPLLRPGDPRAEYRVRYRSQHDALLLFSPDTGIAKVFRVPATPQSRRSTAAPVGAATLSRDGSRLALADRPGEIRVVASDNAAMPAATGVGFVGHTGDIQLVRFSDAASLVATAARDGSVRVWDAAESSPRPFFIRTGWADVVAMAFSADERRLLVAAPGGLAVYDTADGSLLGQRNFAESITAATFGTRDDDVYVGHSDGALSALSIAAGLVGERIVVSDAALVSLTVVGSQLAAADDQGLLSVGVPANPASWRRQLTGEPCRELVAAASGLAVVCRSANWLLRFPIGSVADATVLTRLLPARPFLPGMALDASGHVATLVERSEQLSIVRVPFDKSDMAMPERLTTEYIDSWTARLKPLIADSAN